VLADVCELAAVWHPAQEPQARPGPRSVQGQGTPPRPPRLRRAPSAGLPQMVGQDPRRPPRRPEGLADRDTRSSGNRLRHLPVGASPARGRGLPAARQAAPARRRCPAPLGERAYRGPAPSPGCPGWQSFGEWEAA
jgi:hypothetical protein